MITEVELRRLAGQANVDPMLQDLDYALGWSNKKWKKKRRKR
jgi:hypothetical protein